MILKHAYGVSPTVEFSVGGVPFDYTRVTGIEIDLHENQHDMAKLTVAGLPTRGVADYIGAEVQLSIQTGGNYSQAVVGSIADVRPQSRTALGVVEGSPFQSAELVVLGASYGMRGKRNKVWEGYSLADIAVELCETYGFSLDVPNVPLVHPFVVQTEESDWQFIVRYATSLGYSVTVHGTHMHVFDPYQAVSRGASFNRLLTIRKTRGDTTPHPGQINSFEGSFAEQHSDGEYQDTVVTVSNGGADYEVSTREVLGKTGSPPARFQNRVSEYAGSYEEAVRHIDHDNKQHYDYTAHASVMGMAGCVPGGVVDLDNYDSAFDGLWYVRSVKHVVASHKFWTDLDIARNRNTQLVPTNTASFRRPPAPRFVNGQWEASKKVTRVY